MRTSTDEIEHRLIKAGESGPCESGRFARQHHAIGAISAEPIRRQGRVPPPQERFCEPVSVSYRTGLRHAKTEIGKWPRETAPENRRSRARNRDYWRQRLEAFT
jgi:hypothetical protein